MQYTVASLPNEWVRRGRLPLVSLPLVLVGALVFALASGCGTDSYPFDARQPASGPGVLAGDGTAVSNGNFPGGDDPLPSPIAITPPQGSELPDCDAGCRSHCASLGLNNPVNQGLCGSLWGVGLASQPVATTEACRRIWADTRGRLPTRPEIDQQCVGQPWSQVVTAAIASDEFVRTQRRRWADRLLYNNEAISITRIFDADLLVEKLYRGLVPYDQFVAVVSAHPVLTRRYDTSGDRAEALFRTFLGRPPFESERADLARLYALWDNGYYDHPALEMRLPDAFIRYRCVDDSGEQDPDTLGECTSIGWGFNALTLRPDARAGSDGRMWSGLLTPDEWEALQLPGRVISQLPVLWERAVDDVLEQYLGYELGTLVPEVRENLVTYLLDANADIRAVHYAVLTSMAYLQSATVPSASSEDSPPLQAEPFRWTWGPFKQMTVEVWLDTVANTTGVDLGRCDFRLPNPNRVMNTRNIASYALIDGSDWPFDDAGERVDLRYRDLARNLGGCPENLAGGRFETVSILTTSMQESLVAELCLPQSNETGAPVEVLLPATVQPNLALSGDVAAALLTHQSERFYGRSPTLDELQQGSAAADTCAPKPCTAEDFARPLCYALLSSAEMLFY